MVVVRKIEDTRILELCCFDLRSILLAADLGVPSVEFCTNYRQGGLWPGIDALREARRLYPGWLRAMIRPRPGDFNYSKSEEEVILAQVSIAISEGADGLTFGAVNPDGTLDDRLLEIFVEAVAGRAELTFHRAFDQLLHSEQSLPILQEAGFSRVLSSGGPGKAIDHATLLGHWQKRVGNNLDVVAAGGVRSNHLDRLREAGLHAIHSAATHSPDGRADRSEVQALLLTWSPAKTPDS